MISEQRNAPALAYGEMADILGDDYFLAPTPTVGQLLTVMGYDKAPSRWHIAQDDVWWVHQAILDTPALALIGRLPYDMWSVTP